MPAIGAFLALPEPCGGFEVIHAKIDRINRPAPVSGGSRDAHDGFAHAHFSNAVNHQEAHELKALDG